MDSLVDQAWSKTMVFDKQNKEEAKIGTFGCQIAVGLQLNEDVKQAESLVRTFLVDINKEEKRIEKN